MKTKNKIKILNIHDYPPIEGGGVEVNVFAYSKELVKKNYDVTIATSRMASETYNNVYRSDRKTDGVNIFWVKKLQQLQTLIEHHDIVNIYFTFSFRPASLLALKLCNKLNKPCVFTFATAYEHYPFSSAFTEPAIEQDRKFNELIENARATNVLISGPSYCIEDTIQKLGLKKELHVIRNGCTFIAKKISQTKNIQDVDITYVGELSFLKGVNYLIDAVKYCKSKLPNIKVRLIGDGTSAIEMKRLVSFHQLEENFEFTGYINNADVPQYLIHTKILVHPSLTESWGCAIIEALSLGVPVICTRVGGLIDASNNGEFAQLVEPANSIDLANAIKESLEKKYLTVQRLKAQVAKDYITETYTIANQVQQLEALYSSALKVNKSTKT